MTAPYWSVQHLGCIERDSFRLHPNNRTTLSSISIPRSRVAKGDAAAAIVASLQTNQTFAQWTAFTQWHRVDLARGARPFYLDIWLWDEYRRVRARFVGPWRSRRVTFNEFQTQATLEIERESLQ